jgi:MFS family permease
MTASPAAHTPEEPASEAAVRSAYLDQAAVGYLLYGVGAVTAFIAAALALSDAVAALHSSSLAVGLLLAGASGDRLAERLGPRSFHLLGYLLLAIASACLALAPALPVTLAGAGFVGFATGMLLASLNRALTRGGGSLARVRMGRAALVAMAAVLAVPLAIGLGEISGLGWQVVFLGAAVLLVAGVRGPGGVAPARPLPATAGGPLPRRYWLGWWLVVLGVAVEFSDVFWASTLVSRQVGLDLEDATLVAAGFYAGMATTRVGLSSHRLGRRDPIAVIRVGFVLALVGALLAWASTEVVLVALGIYLVGVGIGAQYPLGVSVTLSLVPEVADKASARLLMASGVAILVAPLVLGSIADQAGVSVGWLLLPATCLVALALSVPVDRARGA